jgi:hypothetical protein
LLLLLLLFLPLLLYACWRLWLPCSKLLTDAATQRTLDDNKSRG